MGLFERQKVIGFASLCYTILEISRHFLIQSQVKAKPILPCSKSLSPALPLCPSHMLFLRFGLVHCIVSVLCDWIEWLRWF